MPLTDEEKKFQNPKGWSHEGGYTVEVTKEAEALFQDLPPGIQWNGIALSVHNGSVGQGMGGIQFFARPDRQNPFRFKYDHIVCIRRADGSLLWRNYSVK